MNDETIQYGEPSAFGPEARAPSEPPIPDMPARPGHVPEKFWDAQDGSVRVDALLRSYAELERHLGSVPRLPGDDADAESMDRFRRALGMPESPDDYVVEIADVLGEPDPAVNRRLHEAGLTNAQAQAVYDLAGEYLVPLIEQAAVEFEAERQTERLAAHFGGAERWREVSGQLLAWGRAHLPPATLDALASTYEGVVALHGMMSSAEPALGAVPAGGDAPDEGGLRGMMRDPRYWRDRDPAFVGRVTAGYRRLFGGAA